MLHDVYTVSMPTMRYICCVCVCVCTVVPAVIAGVCCAFLPGLLCGMGGVIVYIKCSRKTHHPTTSQSPTPAPLYDDIELPTTTKHDVELEHNVEIKMPICVCLYSSVTSM